MPMSAKEYRDYLYATRTHPGRPNVHPLHQTESTAILYWSIIPTLVLEYMVEARFQHIPGGIVFPVGFLLFWAFYYNYQEPGSLESRLSRDRKWDVMAIPAVLLSACIWFVKVCVVELVETVVSRIFFRAPKPKQTPGKTIPFRQPRTQTTVKMVPPEIEKALQVLGLPHCRDWNTIHKRYRELAKAYHPDLNQEITNVGKRFMIYDAAYRKLAAVRNLYFH